MPMKESSPPSRYKSLVWNDVDHGFHDTGIVISNGSTVGGLQRFSSTFPFVVRTRKLLEVVSFL